MTPIDHIVFDIGRVLLHWDAELIYTDLIPDKAERDHFLEHICSPDWNLARDRGASFADGEAELIAQHPDKEELIRAFRKNWIRSVPHALDEVVKLMKDFIDAGRDVTLLSNFSHETIPEARAHYPFLTRPRGATISGEIGLLKPDAAIYDHHAQTFELTPDRTLFIDDSEKNVAGAKACGWHAVQFSHINELRRDLEGFGLV